MFPLYQDIPNINFWIFARVYQLGSGNSTKPTYTDVLSSYLTDDIELTEDVFNELMDKIYVPEVLFFTINGSTYQSYSQAVPPDTDGDESKIRYWLFFFVKSDNSFAKEPIEQLDSIFRYIFFFILVIVACGFVATLGLIMLIVYLTSRKITKAFGVINNYTTKLKTATDVTKKKSEIESLNQEPLFSKISEQYRLMKLAKASLMQRHSNSKTQDEPG